MKWTPSLLPLLLAACAEEPSPMARAGSESLWQQGTPHDTTEVPDDCDDLEIIDWTIIPPRLLSPLSTSRATTRRPTFEWHACEAGRVQICRDRSCNVVLSTADVSAESWTPPADLAGNGDVYFWRVANRVGNQVGAWSKVWQVNVPTVGASFASSGGSVLDMDLDGWPEFAAGAAEADAGRGEEAGVVYVYEGDRRLSTSSPVLTLTQPVPDSGSDFGRSHASAGDLDGNGFSDLVVGARYADEAYVFFGGASGLDLSPSVVAGPPLGLFGYSVSSAGDVDGDGYADFLVGATDAGSTAQGQAFLYRGKPGHSYFQPSVTLSGAGDLSQFAVNVAGVGDLNGDGYGDIAVGASWYQFWQGSHPAGKVFVWYGGPAGISGPGQEVVSPDSDDSDGFGISISEAADLDGDGYHDLVVGAGGANGNDGAVYVWHGGPRAIAASPDQTIEPRNPEGAFFGYTVSASGDLDGDGVDDLIIGETDADGLSGRVHLLRSTDGTLAQLTNPGSTDYFGQNLNIVGDVDRNGFADFLVGAPGGAGAAYLFPSTTAAPVAGDALLLDPTGDDAGWVGL